LRRLKPSFLALVLVIAAALIPGAAVLSAQPARYGCDEPLSDEQFRLAVESASIIVIGHADAITADANPDTPDTVVIKPEAFLKGPATGAELRFERQGHVAPCQYAEFSDGDRLLVIVRERSEPFAWPAPNAAFRLQDGRAVSLNPADDRPRTEVDLVTGIRGITEQYAVPAASQDEGASIDWVGTVLPVGAGLAVIFGISLVLMQLWHRIDPS
jgi:hypothetical protein